jgi:hypothetical protein
MISSKASTVDSRSRSLSFECPVSRRDFSIIAMSSSILDSFGNSTASLIFALRLSAEERRNRLILGAASLNRFCESYRIPNVSQTLGVFAAILKAEKAPSHTHNAVRRRAFFARLCV